MRTLKFRAWHRTKHAFLYFELGELNDGMITKPDDGWYLDDCEIMQCTGHTDVNGHIIYEGDMLQGKGVLWTCWWSVEHARFVVSAPNKYNPHGSTIKNLQWAAQRLEVVGTVYESK